MLNDVFMASELGIELCYNPPNSPTQTWHLVAFLGELITGTDIPQLLRPDTCYTRIKEQKKFHCVPASVLSRKLIILSQMSTFCKYPPKPSSSRKLNPHMYARLIRALYRVLLEALL